MHLEVDLIIPKSYSNGLYLYQFLSFIILVNFRFDSFPIRIFVVIF